MPQQQDPNYMTEAEYLEFERSSEIKHEYVNSYVYAMAGASLRHNIISANTNTTLNNQLADKNCT